MKLSIFKDFGLTAFIMILTRGMPILSMPLLTSALSLEEYGLLAIYLLLINLAAPIITANISAGIMLDGIKFHHVGVKLLQIICLSTGCIAVSTFLIFSALDIPIAYGYLVVLMATSGQQDCLIAYFRANFKDRYFLYLSISRAISLLIPIVLVANNTIDLDGLMGLYCIGYIVTSLIFMPRVVWKTRVTYRHIKYFKNVFIYCVFLIPYAIGQWVISSSSRAMLGAQISMESAGIFAISYTLASPIILLFSICGIVLSRSILKTPEQWITNSLFRHKAVFWVILAGFCCTGLSLSAIYIDYTYLHLINYYSPNLMLITGGISMGLLFHCMYSIYGNILFYLKETKILAANSIFISLFHLFHSYIFIREIGVFGAILSLWISYCLIYLLTLYNVKKCLPLKCEKLYVDMLLLLAGMLLQVLLVLYFDQVWADIYQL